MSFSSIYDEDIMINEERAHGDIGQYDSDNEVEYEDGDGNHAISNDSLSDFPEFSTGIVDNSWLILASVELKHWSVRSSYSILIRLDDVTTGFTPSRSNNFMSR